MIQQFRHGTSEIILEIPGGMIVSWLIFGAFLVFVVVWLISFYRRFKI